MEVRKLTEQEHFESNLVSYVAFHMRMEDPEKVKEESKKLTIEDWGAFSEDGRIMARILNYRFDSMLDGQVAPNGGIGGVSTLPEYRNRLKQEEEAYQEEFAAILMGAEEKGRRALRPFCA